MTSTETIRLGVDHANAIKAKRVLVVCPAKDRRDVWADGIRQWSTMDDPFIYAAQSSRHGIALSAEWTILSPELVPKLLRGLVKQRFDLLLTTKELHHRIPAELSRVCGQMFPPNEMVIAGSAPGDTIYSNAFRAAQDGRLWEPSTTNPNSLRWLADDGCRITLARVRLPPGEEGDKRWFWRLYFIPNRDLLAARMIGQLQSERYDTAMAARANVAEFEADTRQKLFGPNTPEATRLPPSSDAQPWPEVW